MRTFTLHRLSPILASALLLSGCMGNPLSQGGQGSSASTASSASSSSLPNGDFGVVSGEVQGTAYVRGFAEIEQTPEPFCEQNCAMYDQVIFRILESESDGLDEYLRTMGQNVAGGERWIGLGCKEGETIRYENQVGLDMRSRVLSGSLSDAILDSSRNSPVTLKLTKEPISGGMGAPACYSHFTTVEGIGLPTASAWRDYEHGNDGYEVEIPGNWSVEEGVRIPWLSRESTATKFLPPSDVGSGTVLTEAAIYIEKTAAPCPEFPDGTTVSSGRRSVTRAKLTDVGAGNLYEQTHVVIGQAGSCYDLTLFVHSCNLGPDCGEGHTLPFDRDELTAILERMAEGFSVRTIDKR